MNFDGSDGSFNRCAGTSKHASAYEIIAGAEKKNTRAHVEIRTVRATRPCFTIGDLASSVMSGTGTSVGVYCVCHG